jgi:hypothetical protein
MKILLVEADVFHSDGQTEVGTDRFFAILQECVKPCKVFFSEVNHHSQLQE